MDSTIEIPKKLYKRIKHDIVYAIQALAISDDIAASIEMIRTGVTIEDNEIISIRCKGIQFAGFHVNTKTHKVVSSFIQPKLFIKPYQCFEHKHLSAIKELLESYVNLEISFEEE